MNTIIVTRHPGAVAWLRSKGFEGEVREHLDPKALTGPHRLVGVFPLLMIEELLGAGHEVLLLSLPALGRDSRGTEITPEKMDAAGAEIRRVLAVKTERISSVF